MCGIAGILTTDRGLDLDARLQAMKDALRHRGPDDAAIDIVDCGGHQLGLAHTRLAIQDLSTAARQPMADPASGSWIVYNGELYNHVSLRRKLSLGGFLSTGDTETVLKAWVHSGPGVLQHLRGIFAFAVYDRPRNQLWLVRDPLGVKPLYVAQAPDGSWLFASEIRALLASKMIAPQLDSRAVDSYLAFGAVPAPWTILAGVHSLMPGQAWRFDLSRAEPQPQPTRYWRPSFRAARTADGGVGYAEATDRLRPALQEAVDSQMLSDVPVGVFLSGGIDSSALVATLASSRRHVQTFCVSFAERDYDESKHARLIAERFGAEHTELRVSPQQVLDALPGALSAYDQPSIDGINTFVISEAARAAGLKVVLSGLGGDELFAGYPYFRTAAQLDSAPRRLAARMLLAVLRGIRPQHASTRKLSGWLDNFQSPVARYAACRQVMWQDRREQIHLAPCDLSEMNQESLFAPRKLREESAFAPRRMRSFRGAKSDYVPLPDETAAELEDLAADLDGINAHSLCELSLYLANMLLRDTDQMAMAHGLEIRVPFLDQTLVETVARLPGPLKLAGKSPKQLLLDSLPMKLPATVTNRRKMGFVFPWERWLRNELYDQVDATFADDCVMDKAGLRPQAVRSLWQQFLRQTPGVRYTDILSMYHLAHWTQRNVSTISSQLAPVTHG